MGMPSADQDELQANTPDSLERPDDVLALIKTMAASPEFYAVAPAPVPATPATKVASDKPVQLGGL